MPRKKGNKPPKSARKNGRKGTAAEEQITASLMNDTTVDAVVIVD